jgi:DNA-binding NarL/FixJ family response regulator
VDPDQSRQPTGPTLVGRPNERATIDSFVASLHTGPRGLAITGDAGIGKSSCWRYAVQASRTAGARVLIARPSEEDRFVSMGGLVDLLADLDPGEAASWRAQEALERRTAVLNLVRRLATEAPLVIAVDDVPWLDTVSARTLRAALRRLEDEPVSVVTTTRSDFAGSEGLASALSGERIEQLELAPLGIDGLREVLATRLAAISRPRLKRLHRLSQGNPMYALELAHCLDALDDVPRESAVELPASLTAAIARRMEKLPEDMSRLLSTLAVAGPSPIEVLAAVLGRTEVERVLPQAEERGLVVVDSGLRVRFNHPLHGTVAYSRLGTLARHALHARLSQAVADEDVRARHLALCTVAPDPGIAELMEQAADRAVRQGASDLASEFAAHSVRLTAAADTVAATRRALKHVTTLASAGEVRRALDLVESLIASLPPGPDRALVRIQQFYVGREDYESGAQILESALPDVAGDDGLHARLLDLLGWVRGMFCGDLATGIKLAESALAMATTAGTVAVQHSAAAHLAHMRTLAGLGGPREMAAVVARAADAQRPELGAGPQAWLAKQLLWAGDLDGSRALVLDVLASDDRWGNELERPYRLYDLALVACSAGDLEAAERYVHAGIMSARDAENVDAEGWLDYPLAILHVLRGRVDEARLVAHRLLDPASRPSGLPARSRGLRVLGMLELSCGNSAQAAVHLHEVAELLARWGVRNPGALPVFPDAVEAAACHGDLPGAKALAARLADEVADGGSSWATAQVTRANGVVHLAEGRCEEAVSLLAAATARLFELGHDLDAARTRRLHALALVRAGRPAEAVRLLTQARDLLTRMGAVLWAARVDDDLERATTSSEGALTSTEKAVASRVAAGLKNREIAQAMFLGVATVEAHLTRIYRKLAIRSRSELTRLIAEGVITLESEQPGSGA